MDFPKIGSVKAFAVIVDINHFTSMVRNDDEGIIAQFVRDILSGGISAIEKEGGEVVGFMGDAFLGLLPNAESFFLAAVMIAKDLDRHCEWISTNQSEDSGLWSFAEGGASLKITAEYGILDVSTISSRLLGEQRLFIGEAINDAARIGNAGQGNRCLLGPNAARLIQEAGYDVAGPNIISGKEHEHEFEYYELDLGDIWREGPRETGEESYWG